MNRAGRLSRPGTECLGYSTPLQRRVFELLEAEPHLAPAASGPSAREGEPSHPRAVRNAAAGGMKPPVSTQSTCT